MLNKVIAKYLILLLVAIAITHTAVANSPADSIRAAMKNLSGTELLKAHEDLCGLAYEGADVKYEGACIQAYIEEARRQNNINEESYASLTQIVFYYNNSINDSLRSAFYTYSDFWNKHKLWRHYYIAWGSLIDSYIYDGRLQSALLESTKMYNDAKLNKSSCGLGLSSFSLGLIYSIMERNEEAEKAFRESVEMLSVSQEGVHNQLFTAYSALCQTLNESGKYDEIRSITKQWKSEIDTYKRKAELSGELPRTNVNYMECVLVAATAEIGAKDFDKAAEFLAQAKELAQGRKAVSQSSVLEVESRYYAAIGDYKKAIEFNNEIINLLEEYNDSIMLLDIEESQADLLLKDGQYEASARLYNRIIPSKNNLRSRDLALQIDDLRSIYELDKLTLQNQITREHLWFSVAISALLLLIVVSYILYSIRLRRKNRELVKQIREREAAQQQTEALIRELPVESLTQEQLLFQRIKNLLDDKAILCDSDLTRDSIAQMLGTNSRYVAEAIKEETQGLTVSAYINVLRVKYGRYLLEKESKISIDEVADMCGFSSRSRFHGAFRDYYNLTPGDFRKTLR